MARTLRVHGWTLRSGHATGADQAFEGGASEDAEVYLPWPSFNRDEPVQALLIQDRPTNEAYRIAAQFHPAWHRLTDGARALHARNVHQVLGADCETPSAFLVCWTPSGTGSGGTGQALRIAAYHGVPCFDLGRDGDREKMERLAFAAYDDGRN